MKPMKTNSKKQLVFPSKKKVNWGRELRKKKRGPLGLRIRRKVPSRIWEFLFEDLWCGGSPWNGLADPPTWTGIRIKWKNIGILFLIAWGIVITYKLFV